MTYITEIKDKKDEDTKDADEEDEDADIVFDQAPVRVICPHCGSNIITFIEHEASWVTYVATIVILLVLNWAAICVVPVVYPLFKDVVHHCPRCLSVLATRSRVAMSGFKQEVMSCRFGSCVIVLARKYVAMVTVLLVLIAGIHVMRQTTVPATGIDTIQRSEVVPGVAWGNFSADCGLKSYLGNPIHVTMAFNEKYKNRTFHWEGEVHHVEGGLSLMWWSQRGALFVRMDPPQFPSKRNIPDLVLLFNDGDKGPSQEALRLKARTPVSFEATMVEVGKRGQPHVMLLWDVQALGAPPPREKGAASEGKLPQAAPESSRHKKDPAPAGWESGVGDGAGSVLGDGDDSGLGGVPEP